ncbi:MAG: glycosyltransferase family 2 protein [Actinomycetota bacterium]
MTAFSIVVVAFRNADELVPLLDRLADEMRDGDELVVVDNDPPAHGTAPVVDGHRVAARVIRSDANLGFAAGANLGARHATADAILFLNPDCVPEPGFLDAMRTPPAGWDAWMGLVTLPDGEHVNTSGGRSHFLGLSWTGDFGAPVDSIDPRPHEVGFLSGACLAIRRGVWEELGGFPEGFFMYLEDVDLSHRLRLGGHRFGVLPAARVRHDYVFEKGRMKWVYLEANRWLCVLRTYPRRLLALVLPAMLLAEPVLLAMAVAGGWGGPKLRALARVAALLPGALAERRQVQRAARVSAAEFAQGLCSALDSPFMGAVGRSRLPSAVMGAYWAVVRAALGRTASTRRR